MAREQQKRRRNQLILIKAEGGLCNKTEKQYFKGFGTQKLAIRIATGNSTDPAGMLSDLVHYMENEDIEKDDITDIYLIVDIDDCQKKFDDLYNLSGVLKEKGIQLIISNSSFELWFLLHFKYSTKAYSNKELVKELKNHMPSYEKNAKVFDELKSSTETAINNAKKLREFHGISEESVPFRNPYTTVYKIVEKIIDINNSKL